MAAPTGLKPVTCQRPRNSQAARDRDDRLLARWLGDGRPRSRRWLGRHRTRRTQLRGTPRRFFHDGGNTGAPAVGGLIKPGSQIKAIGLTGSASAKLGSGVIKLDVTCGLPCTVSGSVLPPGAKAASARRKPRALPFKSVRLAGSGKPVVVTLRFTAAQKKLATALLRKHEKVTAIVTVTEAPGGAAAQSTSIRDHLTAASAVANENTSSLLLDDASGRRAEDAQRFRSGRCSGASFAANFALAIAAKQETSWRVGDASHGGLTRWNPRLS